MVQPAWTTAQMILVAVVLVLPGPDDCFFCDRLDGARLTDEHAWS